MFFRNQWAAYITGSGLFSFTLFSAIFVRYFLKSLIAFPVYWVTTSSLASTTSPDFLLSSSAPTTSPAFSGYL